MTSRDYIELAIIVAGALYAVGRWIFRRESTTSQLRVLQATLEEIMDWRDSLPQQLDARYARKDTLEVELRGIREVQANTVNKVDEIAGDLKSLNSFLLNLFSGFDAPRKGIK